MEAELGQIALIAVVAFFAATLAGIGGYGTGLIMPLILVPMIGAEATVPVLGVSAFFVNGARLVAFWRDFDPRRAGIVVAGGVPTCILGSYAYTLLSGKAASVVIGLALLVLVPLRRLLVLRHGHMSSRGLAAAGIGFGFFAGSTTGSGVILISLLLSTGLLGSGVIATDAGISLAFAVVKTSVFQASGVLTGTAWLIACIIGLVGVPAAFVARWIIPMMPARLHAWVLDAVVVFGGFVLISRGLA